MFGDEFSRRRDSSARPRSPAPSNSKDPGSGVPTMLAWPEGMESNPKPQARQKPPRKLKVAGGLFRSKPRPNQSSSTSVPVEPWTVNQLNGSGPKTVQLFEVAPLQA